MLAALLTLSAAAQDLWPVRDKHGTFGSHAPARWR